MEILYKDYETFFNPERPELKIWRPKIESNLSVKNFLWLSSEVWTLFSESLYDCN